MEIILQKQDLVGVVDGTTPMPPTADVVALQDWTQKNLSVRLELLPHMEDFQKQYVQTLTTTYEIWWPLKAFYEHIDVSSQVNLLKKLINLSMHKTPYVEKLTKRWHVALDDVSIVADSYYLITFNLCYCWLPFRHLGKS